MGVEFNILVFASIFFVWRRPDASLYVVHNKVKVFLKSKFRFWCQYYFTRYFLHLDFYISCGKILKCEYVVFRGKTIRFPAFLICSCNLSFPAFLICSGYLSFPRCPFLSSFSYFFPFSLFIPFPYFSFQCLSLSSHIHTMLPDPDPSNL